MAARKQPPKGKPIVSTSIPNQNKKNPSTTSARKRKTNSRGGQTSKVPCKKVQKTQVEVREESESQEVLMQAKKRAKGSGGDKRKATSKKAKKKKLEQHVIIPGGQVNETILKNFQSHVAYAIWIEEKEDARKPLKLHYHISTLKLWDLSKEAKKVRDKLDATGLMGIVHSAQKNVDRTLISAIVERWHSETNTFHLPFGEMTITLDDVHHILGVPVVGKTVVGEGVNMPLPKLHKLQQEGLGCIIDGNSISCTLTSIKEQCAYKCHSKSTNEEIDRSVRSYLLFMFGCIPFANKTGSSVSAHLLQCLEKVDEIKDYNWGASILARLYHHLGLASKRNSAQIGGCLNLLQVWVVEHLLVRRFIRASDYIESQPRAFKWTSSRMNEPKAESVEAIREDLDDINRTQVCWDPYKDHRDFHPLQEVTFFKGCLFFYTVVEPYNPDRFLRQFGRTQMIPSKPTRERVSFLDRPLDNSLVDNLTKWQEHCLSNEHKGTKCNDDWKAVPKYINWFIDISHVVVQNPERRIIPKEKN